MKVLVTTPPGIGHVNPMVPLARSLQGHGHEVRWAAGADAGDRIEIAGISFVPAGLPASAGRSALLAQFPEIAALPPAEQPDQMFPKLFGATYAPVTLADLLPVIRSWSPDLVLHDAAEFAGPILAATLGIPSVSKAFGAVIPQHRMTAVAEAVAPLWRKVGLEPRPYGGCYDHLYLDIYPPGLQPPLPTYIPRSQALRPVAYDGDPDPGVVVLPPGEQPLVYLTLGTAFTAPAPLRALVADLATLDVRLLVTVGPAGDPASLGSWPAQVQVERYVPQTAVLGSCQLVVSHGGSGTALAALSHGLPQLCLPQGADQFLNAAALSQVGAGLTVASGEPTVPAVARLLTEPAFGAAARQWAGVLAAMPSPDEVAQSLNKLL